MEKIGIWFAVFAFIAQIVHLIMRTFTQDDRTLVSLGTFQELINAISAALSMVVVAVPQSLPLAVMIGLGF